MRSALDLDSQLFGSSRGYKVAAGERAPQTAGGWGVLGSPLAATEGGTLYTSVTMTLEPEILWALRYLASDELTVICHLA